LKLNLRIEYSATGVKEVTCTASDLVAFESKFNLSVTKLGDETKLTHLLYLAWASEKRTKATTLDFEPCIETVVTVGASDLDPK